MAAPERRLVPGRTAEGKQQTRSHRSHDPKLSNHGSNPSPKERDPPRCRLPTRVLTAVSDAKNTCIVLTSAGMDIWRWPRWDVKLGGWTRLLLWRVWTRWVEFARQLNALVWAGQAGSDEGCDMSNREVSEYVSGVESCGDVRRY